MEIKVSEIYAMFQMFQYAAVPVTHTSQRVTGLLTVQNLTRLFFLAMHKLYKISYESQSDSRELIVTNIYSSDIFIEWKPLSFVLGDNSRNCKFFTHIIKKLRGMLEHEYYPKDVFN